MRGNSVRPLAAKEAEALFQLCLWLQVTVVKWNMRAHPDLNQGPADLQSAALTTELCTRMVRTEDTSMTLTRMILSSMQAEHLETQNIAIGRSLGNI